MIIDSILTRGNKLLSIPCTSNKTKRYIGFLHSTSNGLEIWTESVFNLKTRLLPLLTLLHAWYSVKLKNNKSFYIYFHWYTISFISTHLYNIIYLCNVAIGFILTNKFGWHFNSFHSQVLRDERCNGYFSFVSADSNQTA